MDKRNILDIYDEDYAHNYNRKFIFSDCHADFEQEIINNLLDEIGEEVKWLDVACGTGYFLSCFPNVERAGLDISPAMLKVANQQNPGVLFVEGDFRDKHLKWEGKWDLVSCMWWAYSYLESLSEIEKFVKNLAYWTSERGICFLPIGNPEVVAVGEIDLPYTIENIAVYGGKIQLEGVIWSWIDEESNKQHLHLLAPQLQYMISLLEKYFDRIEILEYPSYKKRKAIVARSKKQKQVLEAERVDGIQTRGLFSSFSKIIRLDNWWLYKIPPLLAVAYAEILLMELPFIQSISVILSLILIAICSAGYGHIINDTFDIEVDRQVGKSNSMAQFSPWQRFLFCFLFVVTGLAVPILMKFGTLAINLLAINYLLPTLYSSPPLRLKERGIWGILSDAAGAHLIPTLFVAATFLHFSIAPQPNALTFSIVAAAWAFFAGVRGILLHQLWDRDNDFNSGISTFVTQFKLESVRFWINRFIFPCEIALFGGLAVVLSQFAPLLLGFFIVYVLVTFAQFRFTKISFDPSPLSPPVGQNIIPHDLYEVWFPLALATLLATRAPIFLVFLGLTFVFFYPSIKMRAIGVIGIFKIVLNYITLAIKKTSKTDLLEERLENLREQLDCRTQELEVAKTETDWHQESLQQVQQQTQRQVEQLQTQLQQTQAQLEQSQGELVKSQSDLQYTQDRLKQIDSQLQQTQTELTQSQSELQTSQTELAQLKSYLQQTQGAEGMMSYYRFRIASNPDDIQLYHQALTIKPDDDQIHLQLGNALVRQNSFDDAIASYQAALQFHPDNFEIYLELGKALEKEKKWDEAIASYRRALELNPDYSWSHKHLGDILAECGQHNEASLSYRRALQLLPRIF